MTSDPSLRRWLRGLGDAAVFEELAVLLGAMGSDGAVFAVDGDRNVVYWSPGAEALFGLDPEAILGSNCLKANRCPTCMRGCGLSQHGKVSDVPIDLFVADGSRVSVRKWARAFYRSDGSFAGGIEVLVPLEARRKTRPVGDDRVEFHGMTTRDEAMKRVFDTLRNVAETDASVLLRGESGTGKELAAKALHAESHRARGPFLAVNCAAFAPTLLDSELFGHKKGAFTGAVADREGLFARANNGTLFLDEVAELPLELQAKLLRVLQEQTFVPVGGSRTVSVDVRIVAATHRSLRERVKAGVFREDLLYRLRVVPLFLPALRQRRVDIDLLLHDFIDRLNRGGPRYVERVHPDVMRRLLDHSWPGNVRELANVVQYAFAVGRGPEITVEQLPPELRGEAVPAEDTTVLTEEGRIRWALASAAGNVGEAARLVGMSRPTFWRRRKALGIIDS